MSAPGTAARTQPLVPDTTIQSPQRTLPAQTTIASPPKGNQLIGVWRSVRDPTDVRTFDADGTAIEQAGTTPYTVITRTRWAWVTPASAIGGPPVTDLVLRLVDMDVPNPSGPSGVYFYSVDFDNPNTLELMYLEGPGEQYKRVR
ncbi:hypothetical protein ACFVUS_31080 [Nocardia sp. NPDC058058]|uniref:hypothetical protein n=1 Tax=Nocardia sp. NPDC058058 TaxID=3346317 RepID=UPI0036D7DDB0